MSEGNTSNTIVCIGTGPSLTLRQIEVARQKGFRLFGCNNVALDVPDLELHYACNLGWWDQYYDQIKDHPCEKWTTNATAAHKYSLNWIGEDLSFDGFITDPDIINHGHGSGFSLVSMAHKKGAERIILLGYDLKYAKDYDPANKQPGSSDRHYFGEYPPGLQHWPKEQVRDGVHVELVKLYEGIKAQGLVEVINCSPDTALECFERMPIEDVDGFKTAFLGADHVDR